MNNKEDIKLTNHEWVNLLNKRDKFYGRIRFIGLIITIIFSIVFAILTVIWDFIWMLDVINSSPNQATTALYMMIVLLFSLSSLYANIQVLNGKRDRFDLTLAGSLTIILAIWFLIGSIFIFLWFGIISFIIMLISGILVIISRNLLKEFNITKLKDGSVIINKDKKT